MVLCACLPSKYLEAPAAAPKQQRLQAIGAPHHDRRRAAAAGGDVQGAAGELAATAAAQARACA